MCFALVAPVYSYASYPSNELDCENNPNPKVIAACKQVSKLVSERIGKRTIRIANDYPIYSADIKPINMRKDCYKADIYGGNAQVWAGADIDFSIEFNGLLNVTVAAFVDLPVKLLLSANGYAEIGHDPLIGGGCNTDSHAKWDLVTIVNPMPTRHAIALKTKATYDILDNGDIRIGLNPKVYLEGDIGKFDIYYRFNLSEKYVDPMARIERWLNMSADVMAGLTHLQFGGLLLKEWDYNEGGVAITAIKVLKPILCKPIDVLSCRKRIDEALSKAHDSANEKLDNFYFEIEKEINAKIQSRLGLDSNGRKVYIIKNNIVSPSISVGMPPALLISP